MSGGRSDLGLSCISRGGAGAEHMRYVACLRKSDACSLGARPATANGGQIMLYYALVFFIIAVIAAAFGFGGIAAGAASIAKILFFVFVVIFLVTLIMGLVRR